MGYIFYNIFCLSDISSKIDSINRLHDLPRDIDAPKQPTEQRRKGKYCLCITIMEDKIVFEYRQFMSKSFGYRIVKKDYIPNNFRMLNLVIQLMNMNTYFFSGPTT